MNTDNLHDAIGSIDEKLIKQVDDLRQKTIKKHYARYIAIAACFCIILAATALVYKIDLFSSDKVVDMNKTESFITEDKYAADGDMTENSESPPLVPEETEKDDFISEELKGDSQSDVNTGSSSKNEYKEDSVLGVGQDEAHTINKTAVFKVNTVTEQGFLGTVIESEDLESDAVYTVTGETVDIELKENDIVDITYKEITDNTIIAIKAELRFS